MMRNPPGETRNFREELTKRALADILRKRIFDRRVRQTNLAQRSGISRSFVRAILRAEKSISLFLFLDLSQGLGIDDQCELLREVLDRRDQLRGPR